MNGEPRHTKDFTQLTHVAVTVHGLSPVGGSPAFPLDEASAHGIVFAFQQGRGRNRGGSALVLFLHKGDNQGIAVRKVMRDAVMHDAGKGSPDFTRARQNGVFTMSVFLEIPEKVRRALGRLVPEKARQYGGICAVPFTCSAERTEQPDMEGQTSFRNGTGGGEHSGLIPAKQQKIMGRFHRTDGV